MLWLFPQIGKFPREYRYILGDRIENGLLDILESLIEARFVRDKELLLRSTNISLEKMRYLIRMSKDLQFISIKKYEYASKEINQIGSCVGAWLKKVKKTP